jgi:hypothetical protein
MTAYEKSIACSKEVIDLFRETGELVPHGASSFPWEDHSFTSARYRRAHISIVDAREHNKLWFMHVCVFPHTNDNSPIFGFDIVAGPSRVSGAFLDLSNAGNPNHYLMKSFDRRVTSMDWKKERQLPDWAKPIFSPAMVALGSVEDDELDTFIKLGLDTLYMYLAEVGNTQESGMDYSGAQNFYCKQQKLNPHTPRIIASIVGDEKAKQFSNEILFPEIV